MNTPKSKFRVGILVLILALCAAAMAACGGSGNNAVDLPDPQAYTAIPTDTRGELTVMMWNGDGHFHRNIGAMNWGPADLSNLNVAAIHAVAQEFNRTFPNIQINLYSRAAGPNADGIVWEAYRELFHMEHGVFPDIFLLQNMTDDIIAGHLGDLTLFEDDPRFQAFNPSIIETIRIGGRVFALPQYMIPNAIFVNRQLAEQRNIDVPSPNWTWEQYVGFVSNMVQNEFYGLLSPPFVAMDSGQRDTRYLMARRGPNDPFIRIDTEANRFFVREVTRLVPYGMWQNRNQGFIDDAFFYASGGGWGWAWFRNGRVLTHHGDPWMIAYTHVPQGYNQIHFDFDVFPRPSTRYVGNHVGVTMDPFAIRNFAMDDGNPQLSESEWLNMQMAWEFATFWTINTRSWEARANARWTNPAGELIPALNVSFSFATGQDYQDQMEIWGRDPRFGPLLNTQRFPGWALVMELFEQGEFWEAPQTASLWFHQHEGARRPIHHEWNSRQTVGVAGVMDHDPNWPDITLAAMPQWDITINDRFRLAYQDVIDAINRFALANHAIFN
jgi:ABC-type glycerol-3-phosphate transport system substrate-binding protein